MSFKISLVHATYFSSQTPRECEDLWLSRARHPSRVDYVLGCDVDDYNAIACSEGMKRAINIGNGELSSAVLNWNQASLLAEGEVIFAISDDVVPPDGWDVIIEDTLSKLRPNKSKFIAKVQDSQWPTDWLVRHPIVSRAWFEEFGLWDNDYFGVYCDVDLTFRAYFYAFIVDLRRTFILSHLHPSVSPEITMSKSQVKQNSSTNYATGEKIFNRKWPRYLRPRIVKPVSIRAGKTPLRVNKPMRIMFIVWENLSFMAFLRPYYSIRREIGRRFPTWKSAVQSRRTSRQANARRNDESS